jgi:NDP-sugar pyrophosphorylase family protein
MNADKYIDRLMTTLAVDPDTLPWLIVSNLPATLEKQIELLDDNYTVRDGIAIHRSAKVDGTAILKPPIIIGEDSFVGAHACLRGGVFLGTGTSIGHACEIKSSVFMQNSAAAHFNFIGDSLIGSGVNFEAGAIVANHFNERDDKQIMVLEDGHTIATGVLKFGALVGDGSKIGANAVLSPGTILPKHTIIKRLELVDQSTSSRS